MNFRNPSPHTQRFSSRDSGGAAMEGFLEHTNGADSGQSHGRDVQAVSLSIHEALLRCCELEDLCSTVCQIAAASGLFQLAWIGRFDESTGRLRCIAKAGEDGGCIEAILCAESDSETDCSPAGRAFRIGCQAAVQDIARDSCFPGKAAALSAQLRSCAIFPLDRGIRILGTLALYSELPGFFEPEAMGLLATVAQSLSLAIERIERTKEQSHAEQVHCAELQHLTALHERLPAAIFRCVADEARTIEYISPGIRELAGASGAEDGSSIPSTLASLIHPEDRDSVAAMLARAAIAGEPYDLTYRLCPGRDGIEKWVWEHARCIPGTDTEPARIEGILCDFTQQRQADAQALRTRRMDSLGTLAEGMAHDINNVLAPILMSLELLRENCPSSEDAELLVSLEQCTRSGAELVSQVLMFARGVDGRRMTVQPEDLIQGIARIARDTFPRSISVHVDIAPAIGPLKGDPAQLHQMLLNLVLNARDAMPAGGQLVLQARPASVDSHAARMNADAREGQYLVFEVHDTGCGIPSNSKERIFEPFFTTKHAGRGAGLGLSTSFAIVRSHGGFIEVKSEAGRGSVFAVYLPIDADQHSGPRGTALDAVPRGHGEQVLVVDDEESVCRATARTLEHAGYRTVMARDGTEAVSLFTRQGQEFAAVVTDMIMPGLDGPALVRTLQKLKPDVRIVAVSGLAQDPRIIRVQQYGVRHTLAKPYSREVLLRTLHGAIHGG